MFFYCLYSVCENRVHFFSFSKKNKQNLAYYFDKVWDYALRTQSTRRTFRTGQEHDCKYWDLTGNVGLERLIDKNIEKKVSMSEYLKKVSLEDIRKEL